MFGPTNDVLAALQEANKKIMQAQQQAKAGAPAPAATGE